MRIALATAVLSIALSTPTQQSAQTQPVQPNAEQSAEPAKSVGAVSNDRDEPGGAITEDELKRALVGKPLFLRSGYMSDSLNFNEHGILVGSSAPAPYTLCAIQIEKVSLGKKKVQFVGARYGLHFLGALAYEDPTKGMDRVKITPKKKTLKITIDRELVVKPKKVREPKIKKSIGKKSSDDAAAAPAEEPRPQANETQESAAPKQEEVSADPNSATSTTSPAHSATVLRSALDNIFAESIDERMIAAMPDFWKFYYQAARAKTDYRPADLTVLRQNMVDQKAKLLSKFEPASNEFAQDHSVAGMSLYHVVIGADGKPGEIAVARPIGFGLDENAVAAIRTAEFEPALKDGKPVPVLLDLVVQFRIFSKRTAISHAVEVSEKPKGPILPGPFSIQKP